MMEKALLDYERGFEVLIQIKKHCITDRGIIFHFGIVAGFY
ncbi:MULTISPECIES: hypothetical protein [Bacillaceae]|nr:hypothetical protein [Bacillus sp. NTK034]